MLYFYKKNGIKEKIKHCQIFNIIYKIIYEKKNK